MYKRFWWVFLAMIPIGSIAGLFLAAVITYVMPKKYESEATIEVKQMGDQSASRMTPQFFGTEFEKIKSHDSLAKVVDNLELINKWGADKETAIRVRHTNKEDARDITAEVARAYRAYRTEIQKREEAQNLLELRKAVFDQEDKIEERRKVLATLVKGMRPYRGDDSPALDAQEYADAKREFETEQQLLQSLKLKQINDDITAKMREQSVIIHEEPQIGEAPVSPNVSLNLILGTALGFLLSPLLSLPAILLLSCLMPAKVSA